MFTSIDGLPLHPLVVHAVVVLLPLATAGALAVAVRPRWARTYGPLVAAAALAAAAAAVVAVEAGQALQVTLGAQGDPLEGIGRHAAWGGQVRTLATAFAVAAVASTALAFRDEPATAGTPGTGGGSRGWTTARRVSRGLAWLAVALGVAASGYAYLAGESGARSVWGFVFSA